MPEEEIAGLSARQKVAILMIALGQETTAEVMKYLSDPEIEQIAQGINGRCSRCVVYTTTRPEQTR